MRISETSDLWWKTAVVYCLDVETFLDWNGDGIGDFDGLTERVDYLAELGVTCLWLMPFYPTADRDDGYDITDFYGVDPRLGTLGDFVELVRTAKDRGMRVIVDLVVNHTSDQHPWFQAARSSPTSPYRDYYVWRADPPEKGAHEVVFPDQEDEHLGVRRAHGQYYLHRFYKHQPDLNVANPKVRDEIAKIDGLLARARALGLPRRRRPVPPRASPGSPRTRRRSSRTRTSTSPRSGPSSADVPATPSCSAR